MKLGKSRKQTPLAIGGFLVLILLSGFALGNLTSGMFGGEGDLAGRGPFMRSAASYQEGLSADANMVPPKVVCSPEEQIVSVGGLVTLRASSGVGKFVWHAPEAEVSNGTGQIFTTSYAKSGKYSVVLVSGQRTAKCAVTVQ